MITIIRSSCVTRKYLLEKECKTNRFEVKQLGKSVDTTTRKGGSRPEMIAILLQFGDSFLSFKTFTDSYSYCLKPPFSALFNPLPFCTLHPSVVRIMLGACAFPFPISFTNRRYW